MPRTASRKRRAPKAAERIRIEDTLNTDCDWTPEEIKVYPRCTDVQVLEKGKPVAKVGIHEGGETQGDGIIWLSLATIRGGKFNDGEFADTMTAHELDLLIEALLVARERARKIGILPAA